MVLKTSTLTLPSQIVDNENNFLNASFPVINNGYIIIIIFFKFKSEK